VPKIQRPFERSGFKGELILNTPDPWMENSVQNHLGEVHAAIDYAFDLLADRLKPLKEEADERRNRS
jgi:ribosome-associated translation inhibitor RaiA